MCVMWGGNQPLLLELGMRVVWGNPREVLIIQTGTEYILHLQSECYCKDGPKRMEGAGGGGGLGEEEEEEGKLVK